MIKRPPSVDRVRQKVQRIFCWGLVLFPLAAHAASAPQTINFQGRLTDSVNNPRTGTYSFTFKFFDAISAGNQLPSGSSWSETQSLTVTNGVFNAVLGAVTPIPVSVFSGNSTVYLEITVGAETLSPRELLVASPFAFNAQTLSGLSYNAFVDTSSAQNVDGVKTFSSFPTKSGGTTPVNPGDFATKAYVDSATSTVQGNVILNQNTLQAGATFYVSSGTVAQGFRVGGTLMVGSGNTQITTAAGLLDATKLTNLVPATSMDASTVTLQGNTFNGAGQLVQLDGSSALPAVEGYNLMDLTPTNISDGRLGANVLASSIAVNSVYPAAVSVNAYSNITGIGTQSQSLNMSGHSVTGVSAPTQANDAATKGYVDAATTTVIGSAVLNQNTLQLGSTFYVSSGTVNGAFRVGGILTVGSGNNAVTTAAGLLDASKLTNLVPDVSIDASSVTKQGNAFNGVSQLVQLNVSGELPAVSGVNLTNLTASSISAGALNSGVIASSIAVSAVYPGAVAPNTYTTITGIGTQTQALDMNSHLINNVALPVSATDAATKAYVDAATTTVTGSAILNQSTLQTGAVFHVSSGTVEGATGLRGPVTISSGVYVSSNTVGFDEFNYGSVSGAITINWNSSNKQVLTLGANVTGVTFTNPPHACNLILRVNTGAGGNTIAGWPGNLKWSGGSTPTITATSGKNDILAFYFDGSTYYGVDSPNF